MKRIMSLTSPGSVRLAVIFNSLNFKEYKIRDENAESFCTILYLKNHKYKTVIIVNPLVQ
ncbi:hypothetical protein BpHYR1_042571 [Brachionus plicatilis]|uniref:Uncharacterized protein n=1 Tax=Brachionus plicatilis TaxID=10195 RepID=A0A3M7SAZ5_BRAPC|nr:hypothetical protein BpHYR1_042571 [Brachionus plicatilis]